MAGSGARRSGIAFLVALAAASSALAAAAEPSLGGGGEVVARIEAHVAPLFSSGGPGGVVLVALGGRPLFRRAYGMADVELGVPMRPDHVLRIGSVTKQFTAVAILQLAARGLVALDADVRDYVPELDTRGRRITVEQVLTHTAGLANILDLESFDQLARQDYEVRELLALARDLPLRFEPGAGFRYSDTGYILLGAIVERVAGEPFGDYVESKVFRPLGMMDSWYADDRRLIPRRASGYTVRDGAVVRAPLLSMTVPHAAGALASTVDDLLKWQLALRAGTAAPPELLARAWQPRTLPDGIVSGYGFGFQLCSLAGRRTVEHGGFVNGFLASVLALPDDGIDVIVLANNDADAPDAGALARQLARLVVTGSAFERTAALTGPQRQALAGVYQVPGGEARTVAVEGKGLVLRRRTEPPQKLLALSPTELTAEAQESGVLLHFDLGPDGRATRMRRSLRCEPLDVALRDGPSHEPPSDTIMFHQDLAWSPDGSRIAFSAMKLSRRRWQAESYGALDGDYEIYVMDADGGGRRRLTNNPGYDLWLSWSPDGKRLVFGSARAGNTDLYTIAVDGGAPARLTADPADESGPSWSPDGRRIAFGARQGEHWQIVVMNADGTDRRQLTRDAADHSNPVWSPDGGRLVFYGGGGGRDRVFVLDLETGGSARAVAEGVFPAWSADGRSIVFGRRDELFLVGGDGSGERPLTTEAELGRFSPDGRRLAYVAGPFPDTHIEVLDLATGERRRPGRVERAAPSPAAADGVTAE
jgi:CubicO group peptidase (beta-lactamase class C family)